VVTLHPALATRYERLVAGAAREIDDLLDDRVMANRVASVAPDRSAFALRPWRGERRRYLAGVRALAASAPAILVTDVRRCYPSIRPEVVERMVLAAAADASLAASVAALLRRFQAHGLPEGLPIGPEPSAVLANAVLRAVDERLRSAGFGFLRWVDDVVVALPRPRDAGRAIRTVDDALSTVGLERHVGKTRMIFPRDVAELAVSPSGRGSRELAPLAEARTRLG
jgi:hypothetical protein